MANLGDGPDSNDGASRGGRTLSVGEGFEVDRALWHIFCIGHARGRRCQFWN